MFSWFLSVGAIQSGLTFKDNKPEGKDHSRHLITKGECIKITHIYVCVYKIYILYILCYTNI